MAPLPDDDHHDAHDSSHLSVQVHHHPVVEVDSSAGIGRYPSALAPAVRKPSLKRPSSSSSSSSSGGGAATADVEAPLPPRSSSKPSQQQQHQHCVSFKDVEVRRYGITVGDNPTTISGPPVTLTWDYVLRHDARQDVESYERRRRKSRRNYSQLKMPKDVRVKMLVSEGSTYLEIRQAELAMTRAQQERLGTVDAIKYMKAEELMETLFRRLKRILTCKSKKKEQEMLWENARRVSVSVAAK